MMPSCSDSLSRSGGNYTKVTVGNQHEIIEQSTAAIDVALIALLAHQEPAESTMQTMFHPRGLQLEWADSSGQTNGFKPEGGGLRI